MMEMFARAQFSTFTHHFKNPIKIKDERLLEKEGFFLNLFDQKEIVGIGELSPLKGLSQKDLGDLKVELNKALFKVLEVPFDLNDLDFKKPCFNLFKNIDNFDSNILFCLEGAILAWLEKAHPNIIKDLFKLKDFNLSLPLNGLFIYEDQNLDEVIDSWNSEGLKTIKIKVARRPMSQELSLIWKIYHQTGGNIKLRLDANQGFTFEDFTFFAKNLPAKIIDYIEDPIKDLAQLDDLNSDFKIPLAIDEGLLQLKDLKTPFIKAWIIKPSLQGGFSKAIELIEEGAKKEIKTVISSSFETNLSLKYLGFLASYQNNYQETACGLDTFRQFIDDKSHKVPEVLKGNIHF